MTGSLTDVRRYHTLRRSESLGYGCVRRALQCILSDACSLPTSECKQISLLMRREFLLMAAHDLSIERFVGKAGQTLLRLACRQLAYKAVKVADATGDATVLSAVRRQVDLFQVGRCAARLPVVMHFTHAACCPRAGATAPSAGRLVGQQSPYPQPLAHKARFSLRRPRRRVVA